VGLSAAQAASINLRKGMGCGKWMDAEVDGFRSALHWRNIAISLIDTITAAAGRHRSGTAFGKFGIAEYLGPQRTLLRI
jgi:hypothetical protein